MRVFVNFTIILNKVKSSLFQISEDLKEFDWLVDERNTEGSELSVSIRVKDLKGQGEPWLNPYTYLLRSVEE